MSSQKNNTYILITQCLQNGFFFAEDSRLCLPRDVVARILVGHEKTSADVIHVDPENNRREVHKSDEGTNDKLLKAGPLYRFLHAIANPDNDPSNVHVVNIRDWHAPSEDYDQERRSYGIHCEANTWEAEYLDGFADVLYPWEKAGKKAEAQSISGYQHGVKGKYVTYYDVRSDSVFDFREPASDELKRHALEELYKAKNTQEAPQDKTNQEPEAKPHEAKNTQEAPQDKTNQELETELGDEAKLHKTMLSKILDNLIDKATGGVYVVVIGVYTDIKVKTLLMGLRSRYRNINALVVSDVLTATPTYERHIEALDYLDKVLAVEVVHSLSELVHVLEPSSNDQMHANLIKNQINFNEYKAFFRDKQLILGDQNYRLLQYVELTGERSTEVYELIARTNQWLIWMGKILIWVTVLLGIVKFLAPLINQATGWTLDFPLEVLIVTGGLSIAQLLTSFIIVPQATLRNNVNSLVRLRNYLETYSTVTSLLRFYMTKFESLNYPLDKERQEVVEKEMNLIERRIKLILQYAEGMSRAFSNDIPLSTHQPITIDQSHTLPNNDHTEARNG